MKSDQKNRIFISGCGRSGTTLMLRLFRTFSDTHVHLKEAHFDAFDSIQTEKSSIVVKRRAATYKSLIEIPANIKLVHCIRHPYDVMTSYHSGAANPKDFYITPQRWEAEFDAFRELMSCAHKPDFIVIKYEDIISDPNEVQRKIAMFCNLEMSSAFASSEALKGSSVRKFEDREDFRRYLKKIPESTVEKLKIFGKEFGYDLTLHSDRG